jgi:hypothetical protein
MVPVVVFIWPSTNQFHLFDNEGDEYNLKNHSWDVPEKSPAWIGAQENREAKKVHKKHSNQSEPEC